MRYPEPDLDVRWQRHIPIQVKQNADLATYREHEARRAFFDAVDQMVKGAASALHEQAEIEAPSADGLTDLVLTVSVRKSVANDL